MKTDRDTASRILTIEDILAAPNDPSPEPFRLSAETRAAIDSIGQPVRNVLAGMRARATSRHEAVRRHMREQTTLRAIRARLRQSRTLAQQQAWRLLQRVVLHLVFSASIDEHPPGESAPSLRRLLISSTRPVHGPPLPA